MSEILKICKNNLIQKYFKEDKEMQDIVDRAYNGDGGCQDFLAKWFEKNGYPEEASVWKDLAKTYYQQKSE